MIWINFPLYASIAALFWIIGTIYMYIPKQHKGKLAVETGLFMAGLVVMTVFVTILWQQLDRPPMRTLGETRLWYAYFLPVIGLITYLRWNYKWFMAYAISLSILFLMINLMNPQTYNKTLMPALQSPWFVPHVVVYIFAYAVLAASSLVAVKGVYAYYFQQNEDRKLLSLADNLVYIGFAFLTFGLLFGALWAKEAWGHYWTWDPKETWAFLTWMGYLLYMHYRYRHASHYKAPIWILTLSFGILLIAWFGVNYLPSAQNSVHTYTQTD